MAEVIKHVATSVSKRGPDFLHLLLDKLLEHSLVLSLKEYKAIYARREKECEKGDDDQLRRLERYFFPLISKAVNAEKQLDCLLSLSEKTIDERSFANSFIQLEEVTLILAKLNSANSLKEKARILWFLSRSTERMSEEDFFCIIDEYRDHSEALIRINVLDIVLHSKKQKWIKKFIDSSWRVDIKEQNMTTETDKASCLLYKYGNNINFKDLVIRIHPEYICDALENRGLKKEEVLQYAELLDKKLKCRINREVARSWFSFVSINVLRTIHAFRQALFGSWIDIALQHLKDQLYLSAYFKQFFQSLCSVALEFDLPDSLELYWNLLKHITESGVDKAVTYKEIFLIDKALFALKNEENIHSEWEKRIYYSRCDKDLLNISMTIQSSNAKSWLDNFIENKIDSDIPIERCTSATMLAFQEAESVGVSTPVYVLFLLAARMLCLQ